MTKFADQLFDDLMREHGPELAQARPPMAARRRVATRPLWLGTGAAGLAAGVTAGVLVLGGSPAYAAYAVTSHHGTVSVSVNQASGVAGANAALRRLRAHVVVVPVRPGCVPLSSLPRPAPGTHLRGVSTKVGRDVHGHRSVSVQIKGGIPAGDTLVLAFATRPGGTGSVGAGGLITGQAPRCVSLANLPAPPS